MRRQIKDIFHQRVPKLTAVRRCRRCGGRHRGPCDLVPLFVGEGKMDHWIRREIADLVEAKQR